MRFSEGREDFFYVVFGFYVGPDFFDAAIRTDEEGDPIGAHVFAAPECFLAPDAVSLDDFFVGLYGVGTHAEDDGTAFFEGGEFIAEATGFLGTTGGVVFGIKIEDD